MEEEQRHERELAGHRRADADRVLEARQEDEDGEDDHVDRRHVARRRREQRESDRDREERHRHDRGAQQVPPQAHGTRIGSAGPEQ
jgi:hypothetical protein